MSNDAEAQRIFDQLEQALVTTERLVREAVEQGCDFVPGPVRGLWPIAECLHEHKQNLEVLMEGVNRIVQLIVGVCPECGGSWLMAYEGTGTWE